MLPVVTIVGCPNVGKSTLFNRLTRTRQAIVSAVPGTTRDRIYGDVNISGRHFILIDTGGITDEKEEMDQYITQQALRAVEDADITLFMIDGRAGVTPRDKAIATLLRKTGKEKRKIILVVNKTEGLDPNVSGAESYELGLGAPHSIAAVHGTGIDELLTSILPEPNEQPDSTKDDEDHQIKFAIVGRPNVGKSTLTNRMLGEERVIVSDAPGTTRDSIFIPFTRFEKEYTIIDTAGVRRRKNINELPEKFSVVKTLQAIETANIVLYVIDARAGVTDQDLKLLGFILECGRGLVLVINKWDSMTDEARKHAKATLDRQIDFINFARIHYISALHGSGVGNLFDSIDEAYRSANKEMSTSLLTRLLVAAESKHQPPLIRGRRVKLRYAHLGGHNPPRIIIHGAQVDALPESYRKFLSHFYQEKLGLFGTPLMIEFRTSDNPYAKK